MEGKETTAIPKIQVWVLKGALCGLELHEVKVSRAVLRGACGLVTILWGGNAPRLPDPTRAWSDDPKVRSEASLAPPTTCVRFLPVLY